MSSVEGSRLSGRGACRGLELGVGGKKKGRAMDVDWVRYRHTAEQHRQSVNLCSRGLAGVDRETTWACSPAQNPSSDSGRCDPAKALCQMRLCPPAMPEFSAHTPPFSRL